MLGLVVPGLAHGALIAPDGRGYELVSPPQKQGSDVMANGERTRAAANGGAVSFSSLGGLVDVRGTGVATDYMSRRTGAEGTAGWQTHAITPLQEPLSLGAAFTALDPFYDGEFSDDLSRGVFRAFSPVTAAPNSSAILNLYLRRDLLTPGPGSYDLLTDASAPIPPGPLLGQRKPAFAGASTDFSHVIFEASDDLTNDGLPQFPRLYEWDNGEVRLAGVLPDGTSAAFSVAGIGAGQPTLSYAPNVISDDGSRIFFTDRSTGQLYLRADHSVTIHVNASEKDPVDSPGTAIYETASKDGSTVLFQTDEELSNVNTGMAAKLYIYDATVPDGATNLTPLTIDHQTDDGGEAIGVMGASDDLSYVYFLARGQLVSGEPVLDQEIGIYLWHLGTTRYIGRLGDPDDDLNLTLARNLNLRLLYSRVTPDGRHLLFAPQSGAGLLSRYGGVDYDHGSCGNAGLRGCKQLYLYDSGASSLACVSCKASGGPATSDADFNFREGRGGSNTARRLNHPMSDDGTRVFFSTGEPLVVGDRNGDLQDVYEYRSEDSSVRLLSGGGTAGNAYFLDASRNGDDVFFATRERLVGWDVDQSYDLYDARVGGGFPEPIGPPTGICSGTACQGPARAAPSVQSPGSAAFAGRGNRVERVKAKKAKRCKRGHVRKKVKGKARCVKRRASKAEAHSRPRRAAR